MEFTAASGGSVGGVTYTDKKPGGSGCTQKRDGGSRSWRNNNPGNLKSGTFTKGHGEIGKDTGGYAIFPDRATGMTALEGVINQTYHNDTVGSMINRYAPESDGNNTAAYKSFLTSKGFPPTTKISDMDEDDIAEYAEAIAAYEGEKAGTIGPLICPQSSYYHA